MKQIDRKDMPVEFQQAMKLAESAGYSFVRASLVPNGCVSSGWYTNEFPEDFPVSWSDDNDAVGFIGQGWYTIVVGNGYFRALGFSNLHDHPALYVKAARPILDDWVIDFATGELLAEKGFPLPVPVPSFSVRLEYMSRDPDCPPNAIADYIRALEQISNPEQ